MKSSHSNLYYAGMLIISIFCSGGAYAFFNNVSKMFFPSLAWLGTLVIVVFLVLPFCLIFAMEKEIRHENEVNDSLRRRSEQTLYEEQDVILRHYPLLQSPDDPTGIRSRKELDQYFESHAYEHEIFL